MKVAGSGSLSKPKMRNKEGNSISPGAKEAFCSCVEAKTECGHEKK